jgi:NAD(P)-dependent dehydrogenase (short-subunit alcohol dehydrogenase family)
MDQVNGRVALVTGASGGLGGTVTEMLLRAGVRVAGGYRNDEEMGHLRGRLAEADLLGGFIPVALDATDETSVAAAVAEVVERWGRIDILLNLAGGFMSPTPVTQLSVADWRKQMEMNLTSVFVCSRAVIPGMVGNGWGRIVSISSKRGVEPAAGYGPYAAAKAAVLTLTQVMSEEVKAKGVTVNAILPSVIDSPAMREALPKVDPAKWVTPAQIGSLIIYLCSDEAASLTGAAIPLYGRV